MDHLVYLDHAATTAARPEVVEAMLPYFTEKYGNPSSIYSLGSETKAAITHAREIMAKSIGTTSENIYFTAGGSESDNWALVATAEAYASKGKHIITSKIEHHAILHTCDYLASRGYEITYIDVDENGVIKLDQLKAAIRPDTILISVMFANNEIGTIQPIEQIGRVCREAGVPVITGPCLTDRSKPELANQSLETPAILQRHGVKTAICTDHPETPIQYLPLCAAMAVRGGMDPESALACITIRAAELAGVAHRVGSLAPGKDADLTVTSSHPLNWLSRVRLVVMDGKVVVSSL